jgi:hypothetical protein
MAAKDAKCRAQVYKELFEESNSLNEEVSNYLETFLVHVLPPFFFSGGQVKKVLN